MLGLPFEFELPMLSPIRRGGGGMVPPPKKKMLLTTVLKRLGGGSSNLAIFIYGASKKLFLVIFGVCQGVLEVIRHIQSNISMTRESCISCLACCPGLHQN